MSFNGLILESHNRGQLAEWLEDGYWVIACLCAAWCDTCRSYGSSFDALAARHPDKRFVWIDIEDQADFIGEIDVENFPTLLIQRNNIVSFFGSVLPDMRLADRLIGAQSEMSEAELQSNVNASPERIEWQRVCNLRTLVDQSRST